MSMNRILTINIPNVTQKGVVVCQSQILATVMTSAISSAISILVYSQIDKYLIHTHKKIPIYDSIGVIVGAFIVYFIYKYVL